MSAPVYGQIASNYDCPKNQLFYSSVAAQMALHLGKGVALKGRALDLACGTGIATEVFKHHYGNFTWHAVDASIDMLALASKKPTLREVLFSQGFAERLPYPDHSFSLVTCNFAFHWFAPKVTHEIRRILKPGGLFHLSVPLLGTHSKSNGNQFLRRLLFANRRLAKRFASQGFRSDALLEQFTDWCDGNSVTCSYIEKYSSELDLTQTLASRGSLHAMFGTPSSDLQLPPENTDSEQIQFEWNYAILTAQA